MQGSAVRKSRIVNGAVSQIAAQIQSSSKSRSVLVKPDGSPLVSPGSIEFRKTAARRIGSMKKWVPYQLNESMAESERAEIVRRSVDLTANDPHAAGVVDTFAVTVVGSGLKPHPKLDSKLLGLDKERIREIQDQQKKIFELWNPFADASQKMTFGMLQFLAQRMVVEFGEFLFLLPMLKDPARPYSLAVQAINPLRLRTPVDLQNEPNIRDGIEVGKYGEPVAYWIKKSETGYQRLVDFSPNFVRVAAKRVIGSGCFTGLRSRSRSRSGATRFSLPA